MTTAVHVPCHTLMVAETDRRRRLGAAAWVDRELAAGAKVYYKGWLDEGQRPDQHWMLGPYGARRAREAVATGQLEIHDIPGVVERAGGTVDGLHELLVEEIESALDAGFGSVAMSQESPHHAMADEAEAAEVARQERGFDEMAARWPLRVLCQLTVPEENETAVWETLAVHHQDVIDGRWSALLDRGCWRPRGDLDAHVARRFGAALHGAMRTTAENSGDALHIDLGRVGFMDVACAQILVLAARSAPPGQSTVLHRPARMVRRLVDALGRPEHLRLDEGDGEGCPVDPTGPAGETGR